MDNYNPATSSILHVLNSFFSVTSSLKIEDIHILELDKFMHKYEN